ncbi:hypothetical protein NDU88_001308 [Pleurodeles waltl]|uniref:Uncharacterized protein n=1 Tax=Pleurodeles waltl TaxID=8319 RepID=A0AAV7WLY6_PLEWA|nr:hypothetical protein NDU88_001308 [Pleurodeles waltl]
MGTDKAQRRQGKKRRTRGLVGNTRMTKPTPQQTSHGKKAALQAAASLTTGTVPIEGSISEGDHRPDQDFPVMGESTDDESVTSIMDGLPWVTP